MVEYNIEFSGSCSDGSTGFAQFRVCILCAFVEAYNASYNDR
jgi:hypothetical protein